MGLGAPGALTLASSARRFAGLVFLSVLVVVAFAILVGLGTWQLHRLEWKEALIAAATERPHAPAVAAPGPRAWPDFDIEDWNYRRVRLTGQFLPEEALAWAVLSEPRGSTGGPGYFVMSPFRTEDGWTVLVNRGFVPEDRMLPEDRPQSAPPDGIVTVEGIVRRNDPPNFVTPAPEPSERIVYSRDIGTLAAFLGVGVGTVAPYTVDLVAAETPASGLPQAGESRVSFPNNHLGYAITWYGLAACLVGVVAAGLVSRRSGRARGESTRPS